MKAVTDKSLPLLDSGPLVVLADQAGEKAARRFLSDYLEMLPARTTRIADVLAKRDFTGGMDAILSLKITSSMTGAVRLEHYCHQLEQQLTFGLLPEADDVRTELSGVASLLLDAAAAQN
jgi:HPt (histidine-containing phosphotransfer) domain-containing protein